MSVIPQELAPYMPGIIAIVFSAATWLFVKHEHRKMRARYFAKYGRYPGEPAPKHQPAE